MIRFYMTLDHHNHHELTAFPMLSKTTQPLQGRGPYVFFLPINKLCGAQKHHAATTPMVQIVQPAGVGRYIGVPKPAPAYLTSASVPESALMSFAFSTTGKRNFF